MLRSLILSRELLWAWAGRILRTRYQQTAIGGLWIVIQPLATVAVFSIIFTYFVPVATGGIAYPIFSYVALVPWTLLASSLSDMTESVVGNMQLITKIYFPREILPVSSVLARLMDYLVSIGLLAGMLIWYKVSVNFTAILFLPVVLLIQLALVTGLGLILSASNVFYRDIRSVLTLVMQLWFYASPIIYPISMVPESLRSVYFLNPMAGILTAYRDIILDGVVPGPYLLISVIEASIVLIVGYWFFKRIEHQFADVI
jgi:ABC-type polysaccharide/polyol phosphate export systems, permease component